MQGGRRVRRPRRKAILVGAVLCGLVLWAATAAAQLEDQLSATPLPILSSTSSAPSPEPDLPPAEEILPTIGEGQSEPDASEEPLPTESPLPEGDLSGGTGEAGGDSAPASQESPSSSPDSGESPSYTGGFYKRSPSSTGSSSPTAGDGGSGAVGIGSLGAGSDLSGEGGDGLAGGAGGSGSTGPVSQAQSQAGPNASYVAVPGPGVGAALVIVGALVLLIARRRLA